METSVTGIHGEPHRQSAEHNAKITASFVTGALAYPPIDRRRRVGRLGCRPYRKERQYDHDDDDL